jgi:hypothetical protein
MAASPINMQEIVKCSGLTRDDFREPWQFYARIYVDLLWALANYFSQGQTEMTHVEYTKDKHGRVHTIALCLTFFEKIEKTIAAFGSFLIKHEELLPKDLRSHFDVYVGFNYRTKGAFLISSDDIESITQQQYDRLPSSGSLGLPKPEAMDRWDFFQSELAKSVEAALGKENVE